MVVLYRYITYKEGRNHLNSGNDGFGLEYYEFEICGRI